MKIYVDRKPDNCDSCILNDRCDGNNCFLEEFHKNTYSFTKSITKGIKSSILSDPNNNPLKLLDNKKKALSKLKDKMQIVKKDIERFERRAEETSTYSQMYYAWILLYVYENYAKKCNDIEEINFVITRLNTQCHEVIEEILTIFCNKYDLKRDELYVNDSYDFKVFEVDEDNEFIFDKFYPNVKDYMKDFFSVVRYDGKNFNLIKDDNYLVYYIYFEGSNLNNMYMVDSFNFKNITLRYACSKLDEIVIFSMPEEYEDKFEIITHLYEKSLEKK